MAVDERRAGLTRARVVPAVVVSLILAFGMVRVVQPAWLGFEDDVNAPVRSMRVSPSRLSFDAVGQRESLLTLTNRATAPIAIRSVRLSGSDRAAFAVDRGPCGDVLQSGQSCDMTVRFLPPHSGTFAVNLVIQSDVGPAREVPVAGTATL